MLRIKAQQQRQERHQQHLNRAVGCSASEAQQLTAQRLQGRKTSRGFEAAADGPHAADLREKSPHPLQQLRQQFIEGGDLLHQFGQQQKAQFPAQQDQQAHYHHQGLRTLQRSAPHQDLHGHIKGHGQHHSAKKHQQHPAQLPSQQPEYHQGQGAKDRWPADQVAAFHQQNLRGRFQVSSTSRTISSRITTCRQTAKGSANNSPLKPKITVKISWAAKVSPGSNLTW